MEYRDAAKSASCLFVPIYLTCNVDENLQRVHLFLKFLISLTIFLESVGIRPEQDGSGHKVNDVPAATKSAVLLLEPKLTSKFIKTRVVALCVVCDKVPNAAVEMIFPVCKVFATMLALNSWQAEQKCAQLASVVQKVRG